MSMVYQRITLVIALMCALLFFPAVTFRGELLAPGAANEASDEAILDDYHMIESMSLPRRESFSAAERKFLYDSVAHHNVAGAGKLKDYDPDGILGFCFGRAMAAHLIALRMGFYPASMRKLFIVGDLRYKGKPEWRFHVATIVKGDDGLWYAIDPTRDLKLAPVKEWISEFRKRWDCDEKARLYLTSLSAIIPDITDFPDRDRETGRNLIELSFEPAGKQGFKESAAFGVELYEVSDDAERSYFICIDEPASVRFDFHKVMINGEPYDYHGYFRDLLKSIRQAPGGIHLEPIRKIIVTVHPMCKKGEVGRTIFENSKILRILSPSHLSPHLSIAYTHLNVNK